VNSPENRLFFDLLPPPTAPNLNRRSRVFLKCRLMRPTTIVAMKLLSSRRLLLVLIVALLMLQSTPSTQIRTRRASARIVSSVESQARTPSISYSPAAAAARHSRRIAVTAQQQHTIHTFVTITVELYSVYLSESIRVK
jgi:hypothetical protein